MYGCHLTCLVPGKKQNYHSHTEWFPQRSKHHEPASTLRIFCPRGFYPEATHYCYFLWSRKGVRYNLEVWHLERLTRYWPTMPTPTFHSRLPLRQKVPSQSWWKLYQTLRTGNAERHLQRSLNKLQEWADSNGFKFSSTKTVCLHFCHLRKLHPDPQLFLNGSPIPVVEEVKFLGIIFSKKTHFFLTCVTWKINVPKPLTCYVLLHTPLGVQINKPLHLYRSLIRSKLDYGCIVYGSARGSYLQLLDPIQNYALRLCLGVYRTSPSSASVYSQMNHLSTSGGESSPFSTA